MNFEHERALDAAEQERDRGPEAEPVGPYAPTRTPTSAHDPNPDQRRTAARAERAVWIEAGYRKGWDDRDQLNDPAYPDLAVDRVAALARDAQAAAKADNPPLREWLADQFGVLPTHIWTEDRVVKPLGARIDALVDVVHGQEKRIIERIATLDPTVISQRIIDAAFERGRQQGDADRAARAQSEYDRGVAAGRASISNLAQGAAYQRGLADGRDAQARDCTTDHNHAEQVAFERGLTIGKAEREAELLEQGWTPPGAVHEFEVSTGPADADLWETALQIAGSQRNRRELETETVRTDAVWFYRELKAGPPPDLIDQADQAQETRAAANPADLIDGDETSWGPMPTIDPANTPIHYRPTAEDLF